MSIDFMRPLSRQARCLGLGWLALVLALAAPWARADNLMVAWQGAQQRDAAYVAARQMLQLAGQGAAAGGDERLALWPRLAAQRLRLAEQDLALRLGTTYLDLLVARRRADLGLAQMRLQARQWRQAQLAAEATPGAGDGQSLDAQQRFDQARAQRFAAVREQEQRRAELEAITGPLPADLQALREDFAVAAPVPADAGHWIALAGQDHPLVRLQWLALEAAAAATPARAREMAELDRVRLLVTGQASRAFDNAMQGLARAQALALSLRQARPAVQASQDGLDAGAVLSRDAALSLQQFQLAEHEWFERRVGALVDGLRLKAAAGQLAERDLVALNALLVPPAVR